MSTTSPASRIVPWLVAASVALPIGFLTWWARAFPADDAYIHLRIASNLWHHGVPWFHVDEAVMGSSSPAWTLLVAALHALPFAPTASLMGLEVLLVAAVAGLGAHLIARHRGAGAATQLVVGWMLAALLYRSAVGWMETPLAILFWLLALDGWLRGRARWGLWMGLAASVRLEFVLVGGLMALTDALRRRGAALPGWASILAGGLPFVAYDLWFFGTVVPAPVAAKAAVYQLSAAESLATALPLHRPAVAAAWGLVLLAGVALTVKDRRPAWHTVVPAASGALLLLVYVAKGSLVFRWYHPLFGVPAAFGLLFLGKGRLSMVPMLTAWVLTAPYARGLVGDLTAAAQDRPEAYHGYVAGLRVQKYLEVGARLRRDAPDAVLLTPEIGALGWAFGGRVIDAVGLVSPEAVSHHPLAVPAQRRSGGLGAIPATLVASERPDVVVTLTSLGEDFLQDAVRHAYDCSEESPVPLGAPAVEVYGSAALHVCWRRAVVARAGPPVP